jgi:hypothetical protein
MSGEGPRQWQFYAQPHHQAKVGLSLKSQSIFLREEPRPIPSGWTLTSMSVVGKRLVLEFLEPPPKASFFSPKKQKVERAVRSLLVDDGFGGDEGGASWSSCADVPLLLLQWPGARGGQPKELKIKDSRGANVKEVTADELAHFRNSRYPVDFCNLGGVSPFRNLSIPIPSFSHAEVLSRFQALRNAHPDQHISTALMNQDVFCGVGQVEKHEALFHSHVHPEEPLRNICDALAKQLILWIRAFDERWMACQKNKCVRSRSCTERLPLTRPRACAGSRPARP